jgi:G3E family GTPase
MNAASQQRLALPIVVLTGFLGSGKTTLLNRVLSDPSMHDTAVLVNEFGEIGVDHLLIAPVAEDVVLLASGCVCCNAGDDLNGALASMMARRHDGTLPTFQRIVLETTGIADPAAVLQRLLSDPDLAAQIRIQAVVTVVDAAFGGSALGRFAECTNQVALASQLVISKLDLVGTDGADLLVNLLRSINPTAPILLPGPDGPPLKSLFEGTANDAGFGFDTIPPLPAHPAGPGIAPDHTNRFSTFCFRWDEPTDWEHFKAWIEGLLIARGDSILRMKGLLQVAGRSLPVVVQGVQHALYPPKDLACWPNDARRSEMVFITRDFPREAAVRSFRQLFPYRVLGI